jgi:hypothetical protein
MKIQFSESEVFNIDEFVKTAKKLGFTIRVTGGVFKPYEINCSMDDFCALNELTK